MNSAKSKIIAYLYNLLLPGLGHLYWKEISFGLFVFLIMLIGTTLYFLSFFLQLNIWLTLLLFFLPILFYVFTFVDLAKTVDRKQTKINRTTKHLWIFLLVGIVYQLFAPIAPANFYLRNIPEVFKQTDGNLSPMFSRGEYLKTNRLAYLVNLFFLDQPVLHTFPQRYTPVRYYDASEHKRIGIVLALPGEYLSVENGYLLINNSPQLIPEHVQLRFNQDYELTSVGEYSIMVGDFRMGTISDIHEVPLDKLIGKVEKLF